MEDAGLKTRDLAVHASVPLKSGEKVLGILNVAAKDWSDFNERGLAFLANVGSHMGVALERANLYELINERRILEQQTLLELSNQLLFTLDLGELVVHLVSEIPHLLSSDASSLWFFDDKGETLQLYASFGWSSDPVREKWKFDIDEQSGLNIALIDHKFQLISDLNNSGLPRSQTERMKKEDFRNIAVVPLLTEVKNLGVIMLHNRNDWTPDAAEIRFLQLLTNQAAIAIEKARLQQAEISQQLMAAELKLGYQIQKTLMPKSIPIIPGWEFAVYCQPARQLGGDFYDIFKLDEEMDKWGIIIADVVDKGVPAALYMAVCRTIFRITALSGISVSETLEKANALLRRDSCQESFETNEQEESGLFISVIYAELHASEGYLLYTNAGHNRPLLYCANKHNLQELPSHGMVLGVMDDVKFNQSKVSMEPGDNVVFYTDGISEAMNVNGEPFTEQRLHNILKDHHQASAQELLDTIIETVNNFTEGNTQSDDMTVIVIKRH